MSRVTGMKDVGGQVDWEGGVFKGVRPNRRGGCRIMILLDSASCSVSSQVQTGSLPLRLHIISDSLKDERKF